MVFAAKTKVLKIALSGQLSHPRHWAKSDQSGTRGQNALKIMKNDWFKKTLKKKKKKKNACHSSNSSINKHPCFFFFHSTEGTAHLIFERLDLPKNVLAIF